METRNILDYLGNIIGELSLPEDTSEEQWALALMAYSQPPVSAQIITQNKIQNAINGFNTILIQYVASNVLSGITQQGKTQLIADALADVQRYGQSGSLYAAITALQQVDITPEMAPFLTAPIVASLISQTLAVLASL